MGILINRDTTTGMPRRALVFLTSHPSRIWCLWYVDTFSETHSPLGGPSSRKSPGYPMLHPSESVLSNISQLLK